jgi:hypothetical protein
MKKILFVFLVGLLSVVLFELFLEYSPFKRGISPVVYHKDIGMWHKKNFTNYLIRDCYENQYFFDEYGRVKNNYKYDENKEDIIILGDSYIDALMVENDKIIHNSLFSELNGTFNVLNYALTGSGPMQQFTILDSEVNLTNVKKVIHFINLEDDLGDGDREKFNGSNRPKVFFSFSSLEEYSVFKPTSYTIKEKIRDFLASFELYAYLNQTRGYYKNILNKKNREVNATDIYFMKNESYRWKQLEGTIYQINKLALNYNFEYNIIIKSTYELKFNYRKRSEKFEIFLEKYNINYLNISSFLKEIEKKYSLSFECDGHWNGQTHQSLAKYFVKELF